MQIDVKGRTRKDWMDWVQSHKKLKMENNEMYTPANVTTTSVTPHLQGNIHGKTRTTVGEPTRIYKKSDPVLSSMAYADGPTRDWDDQYNLQPILASNSKKVGKSLDFDGSIQNQFPTVEHDLSGLKQVPNWNNQSTGAVYENYKKNKKTYGSAYKKAMK